MGTTTATRSIPSSAGRRGRRHRGRDRDAAVRGSWAPSLRRRPYYPPAQGYGAPGYAAPPQAYYPAPAVSYAPPAPSYYYGAARALLCTASGRLRRLCGGYGGYRGYNGYASNGGYYRPNGGHYGGHNGGNYAPRPTPYGPPNGNYNPPNQRPNDYNTR